VSPVNIDPGDPAMPLSTPEDYAEELARRFGPFHTKGLPADTKALDHGVLDEQAFLEQDDSVLQENLRIFDYELDRFETGLLYLYVSSTDQRSHMFWRLSDPKHPAYDPKLAAQFGDAIENVYREADRLLDRVLSRVDRNTLLMAFSDHGFTPYYRSFHLNSWLKDNGYITLIDEKKRGEGEFFQNVNWAGTRAYAMGFNGLYINQRDREGQGIVSPMEKRALVDELASKLEALRDPETGTPPVAKGYKARDCYTGPFRNDGPDILVGYNRGYRASWQTALGKMPKIWYETNDKKWSGDHCMAPDLLPGMMLMNRKPPGAAEASLQDLTATILAALDVPIPREMNGKNIL
jgi:predicted AlkP superfamily phosphohydrolase/phosphomutase